MKISDYHENKPRGTFDFPCEYHYLQPGHPRYAMPYHWHVEYELIRILIGEFYMVLNGKSLTAREGDLILMPGGMLHGGYPKECIYECIVFDMQTLFNPQFKKALTGKTISEFLIFHAHDEENKALLDGAALLFNGMRHRPEGYRLISIGVLYQLFGVILDRGLYKHEDSAWADTPHIRRFKEVLKLIESRYAEPLSLAELAEAAGMSPKYFCRFFRQMSRRSPIEYLNYYRIERACEMLSEPDRTISDAAFSCGFNDLSYFIKTFRKFKGTTPGRYKNVYKNSE
ncbi:MAG: AraC family transcriptional regulator [Clostridiales bacterium]|nr:AraC family transcriptional regulator [Clostridiales bacterium]